MSIDFEALAAPFPPDRVSWRAQTVFERDGVTKALALAYIDARDVMERLDEVCGPENWQDAYPHAGAKTVCSIGIKVGDEWIWKSDGAGDTDVEAEKGALSAAFKRAAVRWGIGRYLYDVGDVWVPCEAYQKDGKWRFKKFTDDPLKYVRSGPLKAPAAPKQAKPAVNTSNEAHKLVADALILAARQAKSIPALKAWWMDEKTQAALKGLPETELIRVREAKAEHHIELEDGIPA